MEVWLSVQEEMVRSNRTSNAACNALRVSWLVAGRGAPKTSHCVGAETLRSLYQKAVRLLKREQAWHDENRLEMQRAGVTTGRELSWLMAKPYWEAELLRRLAEVNESDTSCTFPFNSTTLA
ncbi:hypothetical protein ACLF3G_23430 [Falsiroseomonas sp. HC035]|uniref:hypothetical protein n=1 Tax=Falsiroseomonas sp. HC035 TaxID=3390999 RepID=UPI003D31EAD2